MREPIEYGYARISTPKQNIERQVRNILFDFPKAKIVKEVYTGTKFQGRKAFDNLVKTVKENDTIIFDSVSRMSRNAEEGFSLYMDLLDKGINLVFLKEPHINTEAYKTTKQKQIDIVANTESHAMNNLINTIVAALNDYSVEILKEQIRIAFDQAEKEVQDLHQRTKEGMLTAKLNGKQIGLAEGTKLTTKKSLAAKEIIKKHNKDFGGSLTNEDTWTLAKISKMTFYKYKAELQADEKNCYL